MTDREKLNAIRAEIHRLVNVRGYDREMANDLFAFMDSLPNESVNSIWHDASEKSNEPEEVVIINPSDNTGEVVTRCTGVYQGRIWAYTSDLLKLYNPCKIGKNLQEPVSEKKCMFTKDSYTDEDRKVLCEDCDERCEYSKKEGPVSGNINFEKELYKAFGQVKDFTLGLQIAKRFYDMGKNHQEPVREEANSFKSALKKKIREAQDWTYIEEEGGECPLNEEFGVYDLKEFAEWGANWQKKQFEKNRLKHCDNITEEQYNLETGFIDQHLDKHQRMPTFLDAIEYGMQLMKEQLMKDAFEFTKEHNTACVLASECLRNNGWFNRERDFNDLFRHLSCVDELFEGKFSGKTKVIVIKEDRR